MRVPAHGAATTSPGPAQAPPTTAARAIASRNVFYGAAVSRLFARWALVPLPFLRKAPVQMSTRWPLTTAARPTIPTGAPSTRRLR